MVMCLLVVGGWDGVGVVGGGWGGRGGGGGGGQVMLSVRQIV